MYIDHAISQSPAFRARFGTLDALLQRCLNAAMSLSTASHARTQTQEQGQALVTVHLIAFAHVTLHRPFLSAYTSYRRRCIEAAVAVVRVLDRMDETSGVISPIYAVYFVLCMCARDPRLTDDCCSLFGRRCASHCTQRSSVSARGQTQTRPVIATRVR